MGKSSQTDTQSIPKWQEDFVRGTTMPLANQVSNMKYNPYTGQTAADLGSYTQTAAGLYSGLTQMTPADYAALNQQNLSAYTQNVMDPALARMDQERAKQLAQEKAYIAGSGAFGNERRGVFEGESSANYALGRDAMIADLMRQGYNEAQAATMAQLGNMQAGAGALTGIGSQQTALQQQGLDRAYEEFIRGENLPFMKLAAVNPVGQGNYGMTATSTYKPGLFDYLSAAATAASSDIRLKKDVKPAGAIDGVKFYTWEWNDVGEKVATGKKVKFGVIAQELKQTHPHLVTEDKHGYLMVNYGNLIKEMRI